MEIVYKKVNDLIPYINNYFKHITPHINCTISNSTIK